MSDRHTNYKFVSTNSDTLLSSLISAYERLTNRSLNPADPERIFIHLVAGIIIQERAIENYIGNQNIPSRAEGKNLDALGELFYDSYRDKAQSAKCTIRFTISEPQTTSILVPSGTRVTDRSRNLVWLTTTDTYIPIGETSVDVTAQCDSTGTVGNNYAPGQINTLIDVDNIPYFSSCENIDLSDGGAEEASDEEFYELMRASMDAYSCAGARGAYIYFAKQVSTEIADVIANSPTPGEINIFVLMDDGTLASEEIKAAVLEACDAEEVRPLTDHVLVKDAEIIKYNIEFTYYLPRESANSYADIESAVNKAVSQYVEWQRGKLGRDINPSYLYGLLMKTGIKRVDLVNPVFTPLNDGKSIDNPVPQLASVVTITVINGGYEDE